MSFDRGTNADIICTAKTITRHTIRQMFNIKIDGKNMISFLRVPPFQRRYCWGQRQIDRYLLDLVPLCGTPKTKKQVLEEASNPVSGLKVLSGNGAHALGRVVLTRNNEDHHLKVVDGQQRFTTTCILLTSLRDFIRRNQEKLPSTRSQNVVDDINNVLYPLGIQHGCVVRPTYFDRHSFKWCLTNKDGARVQLNQHDQDDHVLNVRSIFDEVLNNGQLFSQVRRRVSGHRLNQNHHELILDCIESVTQASLDKMSVLLFLTVESASEAQAVFSRLAMREKCLMGQNRAPGVALDVVDLCRNLILSVFSDGSESKQIDIFEKYWAPIEEMASLKCATIRQQQQQSQEKQNGAMDATIADVIGAMLTDFISMKKQEKGEMEMEMEKLETNDDNNKFTDPGECYFHLLSQLRECIEDAMSRARITYDDNKNNESSNSNGSHLTLKEIEEKNVILFLDSLMLFGQNRWKATNLGIRIQNAAATLEKSNEADCWCKNKGTKCNECIVRCATAPATVILSKGGKMTRGGSDTSPSGGSDRSPSGGSDRSPILLPPVPTFSK
jgi:hypothetical protein